MTRSIIAFLATSALAGAVDAVALYGQCGGIGYSGSTSCDAGGVCTSWNAYYCELHVDLQEHPGSVKALTQHPRSPMCPRSSNANCDHEYISASDDDEH